MDLREALRAHIPENEIDDRIREAGEIKHVSPTQIETFLGCPRLWYYQKVMGISTPPSPAMLAGTRLHNDVEKFLIGKQPELTLPETRYARNIGHIPDPGSDLLVEAPVAKTGFKLAGVPVKAFIDLVNPRTLSTIGLVTVNDWKFRSNLQYSPSVDALRKDPQAIIYSRVGFLIANHKETRIRFQHTNIRRGSPSDVQLTVLDWSLAEVAEGIAWLEHVVQDMQRAARLAVEQVDQKRGRCYKYRPPCTFLETCKQIPFNPENGASKMTVDLSAVLGDSTPTPNGATTMPTNELETKRAALIAAGLDPAAFGIPPVVEAPVATPEPEPVDPKVQALLDAGLDPAAFGYPAPTPSAPTVAVGVQPPDAQPDQGPVAYEDKPVSALDMGGRATNGLTNNGIHTIGDLDRYLAAGNPISKLEGVGDKTAAEIAEAYAKAKGFASDMADLTPKEVAEVAKIAAEVETPTVVHAPTVADQTPYSDPEPVEGNALTVLVIDAVPTKGLNSVSLDDLILDLKLRVVVAMEKDESITTDLHGYFDFLDYNKGEKYLAAEVVREIARFKGRTIVCNSRYPGHNRIISILSGVADVVIHGIK